MKLKKIFLTVAIIALLSVTFVLAVSASEFDFIGSTDNSESEALPALRIESFEFDPSGAGSGLSFKYLVDDENESIYLRPVDFKRAVLFVWGPNCTYSEFVSICETISDHVTSGLYLLTCWCGGYSGCNEEYYNKLVNYKEITQEELDAKDEEIVELQAEKSELTTQNENLQSSVDELSGANTKLQYQIDSLEVQVADLVNDKTEINTQLMALDAKLEREVAKSYLQGYEDATGFNWLPVIGGLSVLSMVVTIISLCVRARKKKR